MTEPASHPLRINDRLEQYWESLRGDRSIPKENEVDTEALKEIWPACFLVAVRANGSFGYDYLGDALLEAYGDNIVGKEITEALVYPHPPSLFAAFQKAVQTGRPVQDDSSFVNAKQMEIKYRSCILPLAGKEGTGVTYLLGGMKWKAYPAVG